MKHRLIERYMPSSDSCSYAVQQKDHWWSEWWDVDTTNDLRKAQLMLERIESNRTAYVRERVIREIGS